MEGLFERAAYQREEAYLRGGEWGGGELIEDLQYFNLKNSDRRTNAANSCYYGPHWDCSVPNIASLKYQGRI